MGDKDDHNGLNMKNAGGDRNQGPAGGPGSSGGPAGGGAPRFDRIIIYVIIGLLVTMLLNGLFVRIMGEGHSYKVQEANNDTLAFFCH